MSCDLRLGHAVPGSNPKRRIQTMACLLPAWPLAHPTTFAGTWQCAGHGSSPQLVNMGLSFKGSPFNCRCPFKSHPRKGLPTYACDTAANSQDRSTAKEDPALKVMGPTKNRAPGIHSLFPNQGQLGRSVGAFHQKSPPRDICFFQQPSAFQKAPVGSPKGIGSPMPLASSLFQRKWK